MKNRSQFKKRRSLRRCTENRQLGVAAVEAALCMLAVIPIMFGTLEICAGYYLKESLTIAAYEGARLGARDRTTPDDVRDYCKEILSDRGVNISDSEIMVEPPDFANRRVLSPVRVSITVPTAGNSLFVFEHMANRNISASVAFAAETGLPPLDLNN